MSVTKGNLAGNPPADVAGSHHGGHNVKITARKAGLTGLAGLATIALLAACGQAPDTSAPAASGDVVDGFLPCIVSDSGGFDDKSFNQSGYEGLQAAAGALGLTPKETESNSEDEFGPNLTSLIDQNCTMITTVGFLLASATKDAAAANPDVEFAILDDNSIEADNVKPVIFDTAQAAFLAGYAAADYSKTGVVGTFGGMEIPTVTIFMDGFVEGVNYYNEQKDADVKVISDLYTGEFAANDKAKQTSKTLIDQDADVIMPVAGPAFQSTVAAVEEAGGDVAIIGVDADLFETYPQAKDLFLTSVMKEMSGAVETIVTDASAGNFDNTPYVGTLENDGVSLAPFHEFEDKVSDTLQGELDTIKAGIIDGSITVTAGL